MGTFSKIAIVGTGAIGGYYGGKLMRAGTDVRFLAKSDLSALQSRGLTIELPDETFTLRPVQAYSAAAEIGPCDLVIVSLKATANNVLTEVIPPLLHERTVLLTLENGLGSDELLAERFGAERVVGGLCFICVNRTAPGVVWCMHPGSISLAEFGRPAGARLLELVALFNRAGVKAVAGDNLSELRWKKLVWNVPFNGLSIAAGGVTTDRIVGNPLLELEARALMREIATAAAVFGHQIPPEFIEKQVSSTKTMGAYKPSSLIDYLSKREVEVEAIWGEPLRRARDAGVEMPRLSLLYALLKQLTAIT
jgi:2-dehydropantoate 2-reductase